MSTMRRLRGLVLVAGVVPLLSGCLVVSALNARQVTGAGVATPVTTAVGAPTTATPSAHPSTDAEPVESASGVAGRECLGDRGQ
jgi:hypothetical protein